MNGFKHNCQRVKAVCIGMFVALSINLPSDLEAIETELIGSIREQHVMVPMRDGKHLSTYLYFPTGKGPWPVLYEQRYADLRRQSTRENMATLAKAGYVVALQNFRGTHRSEGRWVGYRALGWGEKQDGFDTVEWLAGQTWSTGKIGTFGSSQAGFAQNFLAVTQPPHLVCQYMIDTGLSLFHEGYRIGGTTRPERFKTMNAVCRVASHNVDLLEEWFRHPTYDSYWKQEDSSRYFNKMNVPCMTIGSWYDFMCQGSIASYIGRSKKGARKARNQQYLVIGPWLHGRLNKGSEVGELQYPDHAALDIMQHMIQWFDYYLKGRGTEPDSSSRVQYFTMGAVGEPNSPGNRWHRVTDWPIKATDTPLYFHSSKTLSMKRPRTRTGMTHLLADPTHPASIPSRAFQGARDARSFEEQEQVITFTTESLPEPVEITGQVKARLYVTSSASDSDFIVRVSDVYPDGRSILIVGYVLRARYRKGFHKEVLMKPGKVYPLKFHVGWMSQIFNKGHRIRVTVACTGAPFYEPNPNTGKKLTIEFPADSVVARNTVEHNRRHASHIIVPIRSQSTK